MLRTVIACATVLPLAALPAQTPDELIGLTRNTPTLRTQSHPACNVTGVCTPALPAAVVPYAGGTGYQSSRGIVWVSEGTSLAALHPGSCVMACPPSPAPVSSPNAFVTGLAVTESTGHLWMLDSGGVITQLRLGCPPVPVATCNTVFVPNNRTFTSGLAADERNRLLFISYSDFNAGSNTIAVTTLANPCQIIFRFLPPVCPGVNFGPITGLAVDWCRQVLYYTDGQMTVSLPYTYNPGPGTLTFSPPTCCNAAAGMDPYIGLCIKPGGATSHGRPCANGTCPSCTMRHFLVTDPVIGNPTFGLGLNDAPKGSFAWLLIGFGPCVPGGVMVPPLCGPVYTGPLAGTVGPVPTTAGTGCGGTASWNLSIPLLPALCGSVWSSQAVVLCADPTGLGTSVSNCLSWRLSGS